jgi:hypothetical protein
MRQIPELDFRDDRSMEYAQQITATLREIRSADAAREAGTGVKPAPDDMPDGGDPA